MDAAHPTRLTGTAANPLPAPPSPGLEQQQGEKEEEEQGCPMEPRSHRVVPHRDLVWAQPHPGKAALTQALLGSLPFFPSEAWGLWGFASVPSEGHGQRSAEESRGDVKSRLAGVQSRKFHNVLFSAVMSRARRDKQGPRHGRVLPGLIPSCPPRHTRCRGDGSSRPCYKAALKNQQIGHNRGFVPLPQCREGPWKEKWEQGAGGVC